MNGDAVEEDDDFIDHELPMVFVEDELKSVPGTPEFYTAVGICICKFDSFNLYSLRVFCWSDEWFDSWVSLHRQTRPGNKGINWNGSRKAPGTSSSYPSYRPK